MAHKRYQTAYYQRVRKEVLDRDYWTCHYCGQEATTVDHVIPISKGGTDEAANMVAACIKCNSGKRDRMTPRFFESAARPTTPIGIFIPGKDETTRHYA